MMHGLANPKFKKRSYNTVNILRCRTTATCFDHFKCTQ